MARKYQKAMARKNVLIGNGRSLVWPKGAASPKFLGHYTKLEQKGRY